MSVTQCTDSPRAASSLKYAPAMPSASSQGCRICLEEFSAAHLHKPDACNHAAEICLHCMGKAVNAAQHNHCPYPQCQTPLTPDDLLRFGMGSKRADAFARQLIDDHLVQNGQWVACVTPTCVGGIALPVGEALQFTCVVCYQQQIGRNFSTDLEGNKEELRELIKHLDGGGRKRECPYCGVAQIHDGGCALMYCRAADRRWNFRTGPIAATALAQTGDLDCRQTYIPSTGLLVRMKMYWPLQPGASNLDPELIRSTVRVNAIAKGVLQAEPDAVRRKPKATSQNCFGLFAVDRPAS